VGGGSTVRGRRNSSGGSRPIGPGNANSNPKAGAMPNITVELFKGRTIEQKRAFVAEVTETTVRILKVKPEAVRIRLVEMELWDLANGGALDCDTRGVEVPENVKAGKG
jgi:4-oxalocrotonate tautomerase